MRFGGGPPGRGAGARFFPVPLPVAASDAGKAQRMGTGFSTSRRPSDESSSSGQDLILSRGGGGLPLGPLAFGTALGMERKSSESGSSLSESGRSGLNVMFSNGPSSKTCRENYSKSFRERTNAAWYAGMNESKCKTAAWYAGIRSKMRKLRHGMPENMRDTMSETRETMIGDTYRWRRVRPVIWSLAEGPVLRHGGRGDALDSPLDLGLGELEGAEAVGVFPPAVVAYLMRTMLQRGDAPADHGGEDVVVLPAGINQGLDCLGLLVDALVVLLGIQLPVLLRRRADDEGRQPDEVELCCRGSSRRNTCEATRGRSPVL